MPADLPAWLREEAQKLRERGGPPRGGEAVAIITEHYARVAEEKLAAQVARVRADIAEEVARLRARVAYLENELDEERAAGASIRAAYDVLAMAHPPAESVVGAPTPAAGTRPPCACCRRRVAPLEDGTCGHCRQRCVQPWWSSSDCSLRPAGALPELFAGDGEQTCDAPHPLGGRTCQREAGHDTHLRRASGGSDGWRALPVDEGTQQEGRDA